ncbi:DUF4279 domain-containing protein [Mechercharimyces sp. CAU 1602]|nr:DUF4279 domain-containing protein [Mechercharimyces sp. CAU 1602]
MNSTNIMVEFSVFGNGFSPDDITKRLSIKPSVTWKKGEKIADRNIKRKETNWSVSTGYENSFDLNEQLGKIANLIGDRTSDLISLKEQYDLEFNFFIVIKIVDGRCPAIYLGKDIIELANEIKAEFDIDIYAD